MEKWAVSCVGLEQEVRRRNRNGPVLNCSQAKTREKDKMKADLEKSLLGVAMRKQIGELLGSVVDEKVQAGKKKRKKKSQAVGTVMKTSCTEKETREGDGKLNGKGKRLTHGAVA